MPNGLVGDGSGSASWCGRGGLGGARFGGYRLVSSRVVQVRKIGRLSTRCHRSYRLVSRRSLAICIFSSACCRLCCRSRATVLALGSIVRGWAFFGGPNTGSRPGTTSYRTIDSLPASRSRSDRFRPHSSAFRLSRARIRLRKRDAPRVGFVGPAWYPTGRIMCRALMCRGSDTRNRPWRVTPGG